MKIGVWISRLSQLRHVESLLRAAALKGHQTCLYLDQSLAGGPKDRQTPRRSTLPARIADLAECVTESHPAEPDLIGFRPEVLVATYAPGLRPRRMGCPTAFVQGAFTDLMDWADPADWDRMFTWTPAWSGWWSQWRQWRGIPSPDSLIPVGMPQADLLPVPLENGRRVVLLPFPTSLVPVWARPGSWQRELALMRTLRAFCDRANARLIVKTRDKTPLTPRARALADAVVEDGADPDLLWLLSGDTVLVHFCSTGVAEAAAAGVPSRCLVPPRYMWRPYVHRARRLAEFSPWSKNSFYNWHPVVQADSVGATVKVLETAETWEDWVPRLHPFRLARYRERFIGLPPYRAGERMLAELETLAG